MSESEEPLAMRLARFVEGLDLENSPHRDVLVERAKQHTLNAIAAALASTTMEDQYADALVAVARSFKSALECSIIGYSDRVAAPLAALVNGSLIHGCEFDDRYLDRAVHTESLGVPVGLALGESRELDGWALLEGWLLAAEVTVRLAHGYTKGSLNETGFHTTPVFGTVGTAAAAAKLMGLDAERIAKAMAISVSFASGTTEGWNDGSGRNKPLQPGWAAHSGIIAAQMAEAGYDCALNTLDGRRGLFAAHSRDEGWDSEPVMDGIGERWRCLGIAFHIWPLGGSKHNVIECARQLVFEHDIKPDEVLKVDVTVDARYADQFERGYKSSFRPSSGYAIHSSWPCNVARMILSRDIGVQHLRMEALQDAGLLELADKVVCRPGSETGHPPEERPTTVAIQTRRGNFQKTIRQSAGHPDTVTLDDIVAKFRHHASLVLPDGRVDEIVAGVLALDAGVRVRDIGHMLRLG